MEKPSPRSPLLHNMTSRPIRANPPLATAKVSEVLSSYRATKRFRRDADKSPTSILSLDFDDTGEFLLSSESDESLQIYSIKDGKHTKECLSKKYGVKHAKFTHNSSCVVYASTHENDTIRYLSTHDNTFIRYFVGHDESVTCIAMHPGADTFLSCSLDDTVRIWDTNTPHCCGKLKLKNPCLAAFDPSANVIAIASPAAKAVLLYDFRQFDKAPFATFDMLSHSASMSSSMGKNWNKLEFSNDGKSLLVGTTENGHYLLDAFDGGLRAFLQRDRGGTNRLPAGETYQPGVDQIHETSGDCCFSADGRYVLSGAAKENVLVWDTLSQPANKKLKPLHELEYKGEAAVMAFNPRYNFFASGDKEVVFWAPDPHAVL